MKRAACITLTLLLIMGVEISLSAQTMTILNADKAYELYNYDAARKLYQEAYGKKATHDIAQRIAECYRKQEMYKDAERWYATTLKYKDHVALDWYYYASMLRMNGKYKEAIEAYQSYKKKGVVKGYDEPTFIDSCKAAIDMFNNPTKHVITNMERYNTRGSDFGMIEMAGYNLHVSDGLQSLDKESTNSFYSGQLNRGVSGWTGRGYLNIYEKTNTGFKPLFSNKDNREEYHISSPSLLADGSEIYYAVSRSVVPRAIDRIAIGKVATMRVEVYSRKKKEDGTWGEPIPFQYNNRDSYSNGDPFVTPDGQYLFFTSDMSGGKGGLDIYYCKRQGDKWGPPKNAGSNINTKGNERFPSFDPSGNFYFSSDGQVGFGGLDIYKAQFENGVFSKPENLGFPINSSYDDFSIFFIDAKHGYLASNREGGKGADDIYSFVLQIGMQLTVKDKFSEEPLADVSVVVADSLVKEEHRQSTDNAGSVTFMNIKSGTGLSVTASKDAYSPEKLENKTFADLDGSTILMMKNIIPVTVKDAEGNIIAGAEVIVHDQVTDSIIRIKTDESGTAMIAIQRGHLYDIQGHKSKYLAGTMLNQTFESLGATEIVLKKMEAGVTEDINNIYYNYADYRIRNDATNELDHLLNLMKDNPSMRISLSSHADSRGSDIYNLVLSLRRANAAVNYLVQRGIKKNRITASAYGEKQLVNKCADLVPCSEEEHQMNRRTEFTITHIDNE